jgi:GTPase
MASITPPASKIDLAKISQRLAELTVHPHNKNRESSEENAPPPPPQIQPVRQSHPNEALATSTPLSASTAPSAPASNTNTATAKEEIVEWILKHKEQIIDTHANPHWEEHVNSINAEQKLPRTLLHFPVQFDTSNPSDDNDADNDCRRFRSLRLAHEPREGPSSAETGHERIRELRIAVIGNVDAGKSTLLSVLSRGALDDGRGAARSHCAKHQHESNTGRTSSVTQEIVGFLIDGQSLTTSNSNSNSTSTSSNSNSNSTVHQCPKAHWEEHVGRESWKVVSLIDLAGHERYLKTTMFGLTAFCPDVALLLVGSNTGGLVGMSREHLALATALGLPLIIVATKTDLAPDAVKAATLAQIARALRAPACRRTPFHVRNLADAMHVVRSGLLASSHLAPIVEVSNVTGQGIALLRALINYLPLPEHARERFETPAALARPPEFQINETYLVPGVGTVVSGILLSGVVRVGDAMLLGPADAAGRFLSTTVKGIQRKRVSLAQAVAGQGVSFALKRIRRCDIRYGMALVGPGVLDCAPLAGASAAPRSRSASVSNIGIGAGTLSIPSQSLSRVCREFTAHVLILLHSTTITARYQAMLHCGAIRQTVQIVSIHIENASCPGDSSAAAVGRSGDRARIRFRFLKQPEILQLGMRIIFREGRTRGLGKITELHT